MKILCDQSDKCNTQNGFSTDAKYFLSSEQLEIEKEDILSRVESKIKNYCNHLRLQVDVKTESLIEMINKQRDELLSKINEFEFDKIKCASKYFNEEEGQKLIESVNKKLNYLIKESKRLEENTIIQLGRIYEETNLIVENVFKANLLFFHESLSTELETNKVVGYLDDISDEVSVLEKLKFAGETEISYGIKYNEIKNSLVSISDNDLVAILSRTDVYDENFRKSTEFFLSIYEKNKIKNRKQLKDDGKNIRFPCFDNYFGICLNDKVLTLLYREYKYNDNLKCSIDYSYLELYDVNELKLLKLIKIKKKINKIFIYERKIFGIIEEKDENPFIIIFDESLNRLEAIQLSQAYCLKSTQIFIGCGKIFIQKGNVVKIINENMGFFQEDFKIEDSFEIVSISHKTSEIITYSSKKRLIRVYKLDGSIVGQLDVSHFFQIGSICMNGSGKMVIIDNKKQKLYLN